MAIVTLNNTSTEVVCTISESYLRLTGGFSAPTGSSAAATCGFLIKNGNQTPGLCVANSCITFHSNNLCFAQAGTNLNFNIPANKNFTIGSTFEYNSQYNSLAIGGAAVTPSSYKGFQVINDNPVLVIKDTNTTNTYNPSIYFLDGNNCKYFYICQKNTSNIYGTDIASTGYLKLCTMNSTNYLMLSGCHLSINGLPKSGYNFSVSGNSCFFDCASFNSGIVISGDKTKVFVICSNAQTEGMYIDSRSVFKKAACFCGGDLLVCDYNICSNKTICGGTGLFYSACGQGCINYVSGLFNNLCVDGGGTGAYFNVNTCFDKPVCFRNNIISSGLVNCFSGCNCMGVVKVTGDLCHIGGAFTVSPTSGVVHSMSGCCFTFCADKTLACNFIINANLVNTGTLASPSNASIFNSICTVDQTATNKFCGTICAQNRICAPCIFASACLCTSIGYFTSCACAGTLCSQGATITNSFCSLGPSVTNLFCSSVNVCGNINTAGYVSGINTPKAWGVYSLKCGVPTILTGYNICNYMTIPITGIRVTGGSIPANASYYGNTGSGTIASKFVWSSPFVFYGIRLCNTVKWPFTFDMKFNPVGVFDQNVWGAGGTATGTGTFGVYSSTSGVYGFTGSQLCQPLISTLVNCAGCNVGGNYLCTDFKQLCFNSSYNEVIFNLSPTITNCTNYYSILNTSSLNGTGSFVIYSY